MRIMRKSRYIMHKRIMGNVVNVQVVHDPNILMAIVPFRPGPIGFVEFEGGMQ